MYLRLPFTILYGQFRIQIVVQASGSNPPALKKKNNIKFRASILRGGNVVGDVYYVPRSRQQLTSSSLDTIILSDMRLNIHRADNRRQDVAVL